MMNRLIAVSFAEILFVLLETHLGFSHTSVSENPTSGQISQCLQTAPRFGPRLKPNLGSRKPKVGWKLKVGFRRHKERFPENDHELDFWQFLIFVRNQFGMFLGLIKIIELIIDKILMAI